jgi:hypothetical protein
VLVEDAGSAVGHLSLPMTLCKLLHDCGVHLTWVVAPVCVRSYECLCCAAHGCSYAVLVYCSCTAATSRAVHLLLYPPRHSLVIFKCRSATLCIVHIIIVIYRNRVISVRLCRWGSRRATKVRAVEEELDRLFYVAIGEL